ncbi:MAG: helix-turn-helix domain-containing protein [Promethearchaeota archaeon]
MDRHTSLADFIREACRRKGVSLGEASQAMGKSRNWLERVANYDPETGSGIKRPRVESCRTIARYFGEDPDYILQLAGYISPPTSPTPLVDEIITIANLLPYSDQVALLEYARLLKFRATATTEPEPVQFPDIPGIDWHQLDPSFARELALFIEEEPETTDIWIEALATLPEEAVQILLVNVKHICRSIIEKDQAVKFLHALGCCTL